MPLVFLKDGVLTLEVLAAPLALELVISVRFDATRLAASGTAYAAPLVEEDLFRCR